MQAKKELRKKIRQEKNNFSEKERLAQSELIFSLLEQQSFFKIARTVLLYWSMDDEVYTHAFVNKWWQQKNILLPSVNGDALDLKMYAGPESMIAGEQFGILEPKGSNFTAYEKIDLIVVPGVAFDKKNKRMGRGRGYYDRLLNLSQAKKVGVCFGFQLFDKIPVEDHDVAMDMVIHS